MQRERLASERVVVVGSGPPGATAALFLSRQGVDVLLLEAGSQRSALGLTVRLRGFTVAKVRRPLGQRPDFEATGDPTAELFQDLAPGGLTNHWSCAVPRYSPEDFSDGERAGEAYTWPIAYDDVAPWYAQVEPLLHVAGGSVELEQLPASRVRHRRSLRSDWEPIAVQARHSGRGVAPMPYAYGADTTVTLSGTVFNSFVRLLGPELRAGRIDTRFDARVLRLEWSREKHRVEAVVFRNARTGAEESVGCRAVVLAAGAIGTPEILLASSSAEFPQGLGNADDVLGRYLHDHPLGKLVVDLDAPVSIHPPSYMTRPTLDRAPPLYVAACMQWSGAALFARSLLRGSPGRLPWIGFSVFGTMAPARDNWVALDPGKTRADGTSALKLHIRHPPESRSALDQARDDMMDVLSRAGLRPRVRLWNVEPVGESKHYAGTCRMHASPRYGMLDRWSRMHAVPNVAVGDSAAFTTGPEKNPVLTSMALAARAASRLAEDMKNGTI